MRVQVKLALHSMAVGDEEPMNFATPSAYDHAPSDRTVVAMRDMFIAMKPKLVNDVHRCV